MRAGWLALLCAACGGDAPGDPPAPARDASAPPRASAEVWFTEEAAERGLVFTYASGAQGELLMPEIMGGGAALLDADQDGDLDAYLVQGGGVRATPEERPPNRLFENDGRGRFTDATAPAGGGASGAGDRGYGMGCATGDADGDGDLDLLVTNLGPNALLENQGGLAFDDVTREAGVAGDPGGWSTSAAFLDADRDGDLDVYVARYLVWSAEGELACTNDMGGPDYCNPTAYAAPALDLYYENQGGGVFVDASARAGVQAAAGNGLGVVVLDWTQDGFPDVFVANDQTPDLLWTNRGDGTFEERGMESGVALDRDGKAKAGMGVAVLDADEDGDEDLLVCNLTGETDSFFECRGAFFVDRTAASGLSVPTRRLTRFGVGWIDFDHDGAADLLEATGRVMRRRPVFVEGDDYAEPDLLLRGLGGGRFEEVARAGLAAEVAATSRGAAFGDVDGDGAVDVLVVQRDAPARLLINRAGARGAWIALAVKDARGADALGAVLSIEVGGRRLRREVRTAFSYLSASSPLVHVGLGEAEAVDRVVVRWPDGTERAFGPLEAGRVHELVPR